MRRAVLIFLLLSGCGGGSAPPVPVPPHDNAEILHWRQPPTFEDNTAMDVRRDVARWDIYCTFFLVPVDNDIVASVVTTDNLSFNLALLRSYGIEPGPEGKFLFLRCVGIDNQASPFSEPAEWTDQ